MLGLTISWREMLCILGQDVEKIPLCFTKTAVGINRVPALSSILSCVLGFAGKMTEILSCLVLKRQDKNMGAYEIVFLQ